MKSFEVTTRNLAELGRGIERALRLRQRPRRVAVTARGALDLTAGVLPPLGLLRPCSGVPKE